MKYKYKPATDVLIIRMGKGKPDHGEQHENVITHYTKEGKIVELEILDASKETAHMIHAMLKSKQPITAKSE